MKTGKKAKRQKLFTTKATWVELRRVGIM